MLLVVEMRASRIPWIEANALNTETDDCIILPFDGGHYGVVAEGGRSTRAHRWVCSRVHGPPPTPKHEVAHSCNVKACVNPRHLRWATRSENIADRIAHGNHARGERHGMTRLTAGDVIAIRKATGSQRAIAKQFGITQQSVSDIRRGRRWEWMQSEDKG